MSVTPILLPLFFLLITAVIGAYLFISKQLETFHSKEKDQKDEDETDNRKEVTRILSYALYGFAIVTVLPLIFFVVNILPSQKREVQDNLQPPPPNAAYTISTATPVHIPSSPIHTYKYKTTIVVAFLAVLSLVSFKWFRPGVPIKDDPLKTVFYSVFILTSIYIIIVIILGILQVIGGLIILFTLGRS